VVRDGDDEWIVAILVGHRMYVWRPGEGKIERLAHEVAPRRAADLVVVGSANRPSLLAYPGSGPRGVAVCAPLSGGLWELAGREHVTGVLASVRGPGGHDVLVAKAGRFGLPVWDPYSGERLSNLSVAAHELYSLAGPDGHHVLGVSRGGVGVHVNVDPARFS
jgi:hypothetical protein